MVIFYHIEFHTQGKNEVVDITDLVRRQILKSKLRNGSALIFVPGATGGVSTIEYEPGLIRDFPEAMERLLPQNQDYYHDQTWHDGNGHSHLRATLVGPSLTVPFSDQQLLLGTWQQIVFLEFDNKPHHRRLVVQLQGEA